MKVYYAHPLSAYGSVEERMDVGFLERLGYDVVNPNSVQCDIGYRKLGMEFFKGIVEECQMLAFRAFPGGDIPAGIAKEIQYAREDRVFVVELGTNGGYRAVGQEEIDERTLSVDETRARLRLLGRGKIG